MKKSQPTKSNHQTYQLLDSGNFCKLEQVGPYRLVRPSLQAIWRPTLPDHAWQAADATFHRSKSGGGRWEFQRQLPQTWTICHHGLTMQIQLTDFGHLGLFAEQGPNWEWLQKQIKHEKRAVSVLNTFAYTGGSTLAAAAAGAQVVHVDAAKGIVSWGKTNAQLSGVSDRPIRWLVDDVQKFIAREIRRGSTYDAIILDPPSFGRGPKGELWKFETDLPNLLADCRQLLSDDPVFMLLSAHTPGFSPLALAHLLDDMMQGFNGTVSSSDMLISQQNSHRNLPSGIMARWSKADA